MTPANNTDRGLPARFTVGDRVRLLHQPYGMMSDEYCYDIETVNGYDAWRLMVASASGDLAGVRDLVQTDSCLVNAQYWYQFPIHFAVREGHTDIVRFLLDNGAEPGHSRYMYNSWQDLVGEARRRGYSDVLEVLESTLTERYGYHREFEPFAQAIRDRDRNAVEALIAAEPALATASDVRGNSGIHWAAHTFQIELIDRFVELGASIDAMRADGQTPLLMALNGDYWFRRHRLLPDGDHGEQLKSVIEHLLSRGATYGLSCAIHNSDGSRTRELLDATPELATQLDTSRRSFLYYAARAQRADIAEMLIALGANPAAPEDLAPRGRALHEAASRSDAQTVRLLLENGADPNCDVDSSGSALFISKHKDPDGSEGEKVRRLLSENGALTPSYDMTRDEVEEYIRGDITEGLDHGIIHRVFELDDPLLIHGLADHHPDALRIVPVMGPYPRSRPCIDAVMERGADPNNSDWLGKTWLHYIAGKGDIEAAEAFIDHGADVNAIESEHRRTPLGEASKNGHVDIVRLLLDRGADPNVPEELWARPLTWASANGHEEVADMLRVHGAVES